MFYQGKILAWIGDEGERKVAVPDAAFKIIIRDKTEEEKSKTTFRGKETPEILAFLYPQLGTGYSTGTSVSSPQSMRSKS